MALRRKNNPDFFEGVDALGRRSWLKRHTVTDPVNIQSLRSAFVVDEIPASALPPQLSETEVFHKEFDVESACDKAVSQVPRPLVPDGFSRAYLGTIGVSVAAFFGGIGAPFLAVPLLGVTGAMFVTNPVRRFFAHQKAKREVLRKQKPTNTFRSYEKEAKELATSYPHWNPDRIKVKPSTRNMENLQKSQVTRKVDENGVGFLRWKEKRYGDKTLSGKYLFYPGVNLSRRSFRFPVDLPGVNLRGAKLDITTLTAPSNFSGADLRDANLSGSRWDVRLKDACLRGALLVGGDFSDCDMDGADIAGADVTDAKLPFDLTNVNIYREQFDSLAGLGPGGAGRMYRVKEAAFEDVVKKFDGDKDLVSVMLWSGELEVRDRKTSLVVAESYDPEKHYIPYWVAEE
jgi:hypothetical protein